MQQQKGVHYPFIHQTQKVRVKSLQTTIPLSNFDLSTAYEGSMRSEGDNRISGSQDP